MIFLYRLRAIIVVTLKRIIAQPLLSASTMFGLTIAVALMMTVVLYGESVSYRILTERLQARQEQSTRPPFAYLFNYVGSWRGPVNLEVAQRVENYFRQGGADRLGLHVDQFVSHYETAVMRLFPGDTSNYANENSIITYVSMGSADDIEQHIEMIEGQYAQPAVADPESVVEVMITEPFATKFGMQVGETYLLHDRKLDQTDSQATTEVRIAGVWRAKDPTEGYWFYSEVAFDDMLLVPRDTFVNRISPYREGEINLAVWYVVADGSKVSTTQVNNLIASFDEVEKQIDALLPSTYALLSPIDQLIPYRRTASQLTVLLTGISIPVIGLLLIFVVLVINLSAEQRRNENAIIRSRGSSPGQVIGLAALEGLILGIFSLFLGTGLAVLLTKLMGKTQSFMDFSGTTDLAVTLPPNAIFAVVLALLISVMIHVLPAISASRHTIISYKSSRARVLVRPLWQRLGFDLVLLVITGYFYYLLREQGNLFVTGSNTTSLEESYANPFLFLLPQLTIFSFSLLALRLLSQLMRFIGWLLQFTDRVGLIIATRHLQRSPQYYYQPAILLLYTVSLGLFTASFARTLDRSLYEQYYYRWTADLNGRVLIESFLQSDSQQYFHISEYRDLPYIDSVTRINDYSAREISEGINGQFVAIDRAEFAETAFWRPDFAHERLGDLMNRLALKNGILVSSDFIKRTAYKVGDLVRLNIQISDVRVEMDAQIVGVVDYFPSWYPDEDGTLFVGNMDYLFEQAGSELPYTIIARTSPDVDYNELRNAIVRKGASTLFYNEPFSYIKRDQSRSDRQGLLGMLSVGFIATTVTTIQGFFLYALFSYNRRFVELGVLRAVGLKRSEMTASIAWELGMLIITGLVLGLLLGILVSQLYIPYLQIGTRERELVPPYLTTMAWQESGQIVAVFVLLFTSSMAVLMVILRRMKIFQAVKLGEIV